MTGVVEISHTHNPFTRDGIRIENAVPHYADLPESLLALLRSKVEAAPEVEAIVEARITAMLVHNPARYFTGGQE